MNRIWINSEDIRQFIYCKRKIYWRDIARITQVPTKLMIRGEKFHKIKIKQTKSKHKEYREYYMKSDNYGFIAVADHILEFENSLIIIEYKYQYELDYINQGSKSQLVFISIVAKDVFSKSCTVIEIRTNNGRKIKGKITENDVKLVMDIADEIKQMYEIPVIPETCRNKNQCPPCEYYHFCLRS